MKPAFFEFKSGYTVDFASSLEPCKVGLIALNCLGEVLGCLGLLFVQDEHG